MSRRASDARRSAAQIFRVPILLGALSAVGLVSALVGDDLWDALSWFALGVPSVVMLWYWLFARAPGRRGK